MKITPAQRLCLFLGIAGIALGGASVAAPTLSLEVRPLTYLPTTASRVPEKPLSHPIETVRALNRDGADILKIPGAPTYLAIGALVLGTDSHTRKWFQSSSEESDHRFSNRLSRFGDGKNLLILAATLHAGGRREREAGRLLLAAELNTLLWSQSIKGLTGRERPNSQREPGHWHGPSSFKNDSFPSGHTTAATAAAVVLGHEYPKAKTVFYTLAALVGVARVKGGMHYPSDVYWGTGVGYYCGLQALQNRDGIIRWRF